MKYISRHPLHTHHIPQAISYNFTRNAHQLAPLPPIHPAGHRRRLRNEHVNRNNSSQFQLHPLRRHIRQRRLRISLQHRRRQSSTSVAGRRSRKPLLGHHGPRAKVSLRRQRTQRRCQRRGRFFLNRSLHRQTDAHQQPLFRRPGTLPRGRGRNRQNAGHRQLHQRQRGVVPARTRRQNRRARLTNGRHWIRTQRETPGRPARARNSHQRQQSISLCARSRPGPDSRLQAGHCHRPAHRRQSAAFFRSARIRSAPHRLQPER